MPTKRVRRSNHKKTKKVFITKLKILYPNCKHDSVDSNLYNNNNITYGEMNYDGIEKLYNYIIQNYNANINTFIDLGSGRGKLCMYMAAQSKIKHVLGVELVKERYNDAEVLKSELQHDFANKVKLLNENILNVDFTNYKNKQIFIWLSNLCFGLSNTDNIFQKLQTDLPSGTIICCSKKPESTTLECLTTIQIPMSWCNSSNVYLYRL